MRKVCILQYVASVTNALITLRAAIHLRGRRLQQSGSTRVIPPHATCYNYNNFHCFFADLEAQLKSFVHKETLVFHDNVAEDALRKAQNGDIEAEDVIKKFERLFKEV